MNFVIILIQIGLLTVYIIQIMLKDKDSKQSIQVTIRVRPLSQKQSYQDSRICVKFQHNNSLHLINNNQSKKFTFDSICFNQSQEEIFNRVGKKCTADCLEGYNCTIFAYGQTGAGKTYTMMGISFQNQKYYQHRGLIPRTMQYLFDCIERQRQNGVNFIIRCSFLEIYNEQIIDLLNKVNNNLQLRQDTRKGVYVQGITQQIISRSEEAMQILYKGSKSRHVGSTFYNETSSRSHSVFTMQIQSRYSKNGVINTKSRQFNFIDLAGSQRTKQSTGERLKQGCNINKSLMNLAAVINALSQVSEGKMQHVNYRNSKLTFLLKDSLGGNSKTNLIANISPGTVFYQQTLSTLGFARRAKLIKRQKASINQDSSGNIQSMKNQIKRLKQQVITLMSRVQNSSSDDSNLAIQSNSSEMTTIMHQYVEQQIDKQTKLQLQILKLTDRIQNLQKGIKQYSTNEIQLRMIISIYEDKINRLKNIQKLLIQKINDLSQSDQQSKNIIQYFTNQRMSLIKQAQIFKKQAQNLKFLRQLFKQAKIMKDEGQDDSLKELLTKNTNFLNIIHSKLDVMKIEKMQVQFGTQFQKKINSITIQFNKKQEQYIQRLDQFNLEVNDYRNRNQQNQKLLEEAINGQMILQQKLQTQISNNEARANQILEKKKEISKLQKMLEENIKKNEENCTEFKSILESKQMTISMLRNDNQSLKTKLQKSIINDKIFKEQFENLQQQKYKIEKMMMANIQELKQLKNNGLKFQSQIAIFNQKIQSLQNQKLLLKQENKKITLTFAEKQSTFQQKYAELSTNYDNQSIKKQKQIQQLKQKYLFLEQQQQTQKKFLLKRQQQIQNISLMLKKQQNEHKQQLNSLSQKNKQLIYLINQKKLTDNQINVQLNKLKLQIIQLNSQKQSIEYKYKIHLQDLLQKINKQTLSFQNIKKQLQQKNNHYKQVVSQLNSKNKQIYQIQENNIKLEHNISNIREQLIISNERIVDYEGVIENLKQKQKQLKINVINIKNELFVTTKNSQIQLQAYKSQIALKDQLIEQLEKQNMKNKNKYQKHLSDIQKQLDTNKELFQNHEESMKKSMENHLLTKEKKIQEIKAVLEESQAKLKQKQLIITSLNNKIEDAQLLHTNQQKDLARLNQLILEKENKIQILLSQLNEMKQKYEKQIEQNEIIHGEQIDQKNQQIEFYMIENQNYLKNVDNLKAQNELNKVQVEQLKLKIRALETQIQEQKVQKLQINLKNNQIQQNLNEVTLKQKQITLKFYQITLQLQQNQKQFDSYKQIKQSQLSFIKNMQNSSLKEVNEMNQTLNKQLEQSKHSYIAQIQKTYSLGVQIQSCKKIIEQQKMTILLKQKRINDLQFQNKKIQEEVMQQNITIIEKQKKINDLEYLNKKLSQEIQQLNAFIHDKQQKNKQLTNKLTQSNENSYIQLQKAQNHIKKLQQTIQLLKISFQNQQQSLIKQTQCKKLYEQNMKQQQSNIKSLQFQLQKTQQQIKNMLQNEASMTTQIQQIFSKYKKQQQQVTKYKLLNQNYKIQLQQKDNMLILLKNEQKKNKTNLDELLLKHSKQIDKNMLQLNFYIQQGKKFTQQIINQEHILQKLGQDNQKLKINEINNQQIIRQMNISLQQMKLKNQNLINQGLKLRKSNQQEQISKENIYRQLCKEKQNINNLKMLIDNKSAQNCVLQHELQQKDSIYKKLVQKIAKNQNQNKKATNSEHYLRTIQLLEKSRAEQIQLRKQNQEFKRIIGTMKEALEQKDANSKQIQKKSQNYCISMHKRMQQIQNDYVQLQRKQEKLLKQKKNLEKYALQSQQSKQQIKNLKSNIIKNIQRYEQLQCRLKKSNLEYIQLQKQFQEYKKGQSIMFNNTDDKTTYINRLKAQIAALKTEKTLLTDTLNKQRQQKIKLKADIKYGKDSNSDTSGKTELDKKIHENKNLQELIFEIVSHLKICVNEPKTKLQAIRSVILSTIKEKNSQIKNFKQKIKQLQFQLQKNGSTKPEYAVYRQKNRQIKALSISNANRNSHNNEQLLRFQKEKDPSFLSNNSRQKIKQFENHYSRLGQTQDNFRNKIN